MSISTLRLLAVGTGAWALVASAGVAAGQDTRKTDSDKPSVLGGPAVNDTGIPGEKRSFAGGGRPRDRMDRGTPPRMFMQALAVLRGDQAGEGVRLTAGQEEMIRAVQADFQTALKAYMDAHHDEVAELRSSLSPEARARFDQRTRAAGLGAPGDFERRPGKARDRAAKKGDKPVDHPSDEMDAPVKSKSKAGKDGSTPTGDEAIKQRLVEILEGAPKPKDAQAKVMAFLSEPQKDLVRVEIERLRKANDKKTDAAAPAPGRPDLSGLPENARERLKNLPPEQREEAMRRLQERRVQRQAGQQKPAPSSQDVDVPNPDQKADRPAPRRKN